MKNTRLLSEFEAYTDGPDCSHDISLMEYGLGIRQVNDVFYCVIGIDHDGHQYTTFYESEIAQRDLSDLMTGRDWMDKKDVQNVLESCGLEFNSFRELYSYIRNGGASIIQDISNYYGIENIMDAPYWKSAYFHIIDDDMETEDKAEFIISELEKAHGCYNFSLENFEYIGTAANNIIIKCTYSDTVKICLRFDASDCSFFDYVVSENSFEKRYGREIDTTEDYFGAEGQISTTIDNYINY